MHFLFDSKVSVCLFRSSAHPQTSRGPAPAHSRPEPEKPSLPGGDTIQSLLRTLAVRDPYTAHHSLRVTRIAVWLARHLGFNSQETAALRTAGLLHDIGKIGISEAILNKPGPLTPEERAVITTHPLIGERIVAPLKLRPEEREIILLHHERWDGTGYPRGLAGPEIPLLCRIISLADVYDALTSDRPYRRRFTPAEALAEIEAQAGRQFDPDLSRRFVALLRLSRQDFPPSLHYPYPLPGAR